MKTQAKIDFFYTMPYNEAEKQCLMPETPARNLLNMKERGHYMLKGKTVLLAVTGSIAAYKIAYLSKSLMRMCTY